MCGQLWLLAAMIGAAGEEKAPPPVRVMSFNVRYGTARDGENHWDKRKAFLAETVKKFDPDLLGTQETLGFQRDYLAKELPAYGVLGVGRDDGKEKGEMMALYYRKARFEKTDGGHFWLSETPDKAGSRSWGSSLPRMVSWVKLRDRKAPKAPALIFYNTHFDHLSGRARTESARLLRKRIDRLDKGTAVIVTGDFNAGEGSEPYKALFGKQDEKVSPLRDTYRVAHPKKGESEGTFSGFKAGAKKGARIDWIACTDHLKVLKAGIDRTERKGRTPSDHFPVTAVLEWKSGGE
jgi:endonuclease/exonuclease/phosphatase family metal-dependent hydrolase